MKKDGEIIRDSVKYLVYSTNSLGIARETEKAFALGIYKERFPLSTKSLLWVPKSIVKISQVSRETQEVKIYIPIWALKGKVEDIDLFTNKDAFSLSEDWILEDYSNKFWGL